MGVYWKWICREKEQQIDPGSDALGESVKVPFGPRTMAALQCALMYGPWYGQAIELISDSGDLYDKVEGDPHMGEPGWDDIGGEYLEVARSHGKDV